MAACARASLWARCALPSAGEVETVIKKRAVVSFLAWPESNRRAGAACAPTEKLAAGVMIKKHAACRERRRRLSRAYRRRRHQACIIIEARSLRRQRHNGNAPSPRHVARPRTNYGRASCRSSPPAFFCALIIRRPETTGSARP